MSALDPTLTCKESSSTSDAHHRGPDDFCPGQESRWPCPAWNENYPGRMTIFAISLRRIPDGLRNALTKASTPPGTHAEATCWRHRCLFSHSDDPILEACQFGKRRQQGGWRLSKAPSN